MKEVTIGLLSTRSVRRSARSTQVERALRARFRLWVQSREPPDQSLPGMFSQLQAIVHLANYLDSMLERINRYRYLIPKTFKKGMQVEGLVYANETLIRQIEKDQTLDQVANVATLPGWAGRSLAMPDAHQGYGFCIGGVAAADLKQGIVSAGGVGFDINCGVRLLASPWTDRRPGQSLSRY